LCTDTGLTLLGSGVRSIWCILSTGGMSFGGLDAANACGVN
jgi:hypothetical protein